MKKGLLYTGSLLIIGALNVSEILADNPFDWQPYEHDEAFDNAQEISSHQPAEEKQEARLDNQQEKGE